MSDFAPKAVVLQDRLIITEYTTSGKTISTSLMSHMRETKITKKDDEEKVLKDGFSVAVWFWLCFLLLFLLLQSIKNIKEDLKERSI